MAIYAIADLHLSLDGKKAMDVFGGQWEGYMKKIEENWKRQVNENDTVIVGGDFCWAMDLKETYSEFLFLENLPGKKILLKGNHDYWWNTQTSMKKFLQEHQLVSIDFLYNNSFLVEEKVIVGTRGWTFNGEENAEKILKRENQRLILSIEDGIRRFGDEREKIAFIHYPPIVRGSQIQEKDMLFIQTLKKYGVKRCYYGHLHGGAHKEAIEGDVQGINLQLISGDYLDFQLVKVS